ncbi:MAG: NAD(P)-binding protein [Phycisphaerales bacterium]|nr:NAD(P)-binding protein [Phycisphaerae bacterium]NNM26973.1 NAD(P)-binding protein [Phycisphaerales bacterium]
MLSRRAVLHGGLGALASGFLPLPRRLTAAGPPTGFDPGRVAFPPGAPFVRVSAQPAVRLVDGVPFAVGLTGEPYPDPHLRFPEAGVWFPPDRPPTPTEEVSIAVVGGGISGLSTAHMLRAHKPVLLELNRSFGGSARGEWWGNVPYALGSAYVITPDSGSVLEEIYQSLGLHEMYRLDAGVSEIELAGEVLQERFWSGAAAPPGDQKAFDRYAEVVRFMAERSYPEIPVDPGPGGDWVRELDAVTFKNDVETRMGMPAPPLLAAAVQAYCYSSFGAGWEEISAASGWNFLAAEEFGRWVFPGGNAQMAYQFYRQLAEADAAGPDRLRAGALVVDVRLVPRGVQVTWVDPADELHALVAQRVVMACPKNVCRRVLHDAERLDPEKFEAMHQIHHAGYVVANILLNAPIERDFYDIFLLRDGDFPTDAVEAEESAKVVDMLNGRFALGATPGARSVLTLYWPLPWAFGQHTLLLGEQTWENYAQRLVPQVRRMLRLLDVGLSDIDHVRMTYFGHAMPVATPGFIANGAAELVRRPIEDKIFFVQQDNWALPAIENCLLDAHHFAPQIAAGLP